MNAIQYVKNVGKSFGYASIDVLKSYNPAFTSMASAAKDLSSDLYQSIKDFKYNASNKMSGDEQSLVGQAKDVVFDFWKNTREDLLSGNFYNKQRIKQVEDEQMSAMFGDLSFDFNLDDDFGDFEFDDDNEVSADTKVEADIQVQTTKAMIQSMDNVGAKVAGTVSTTVVKSTDYIVAAQERASKAMYDLTSRGFGQVGTGLAALNANMSTIVTLAEPLTIHMQNSANFYTKSSEYQAKTLELLGKIVENTSPKSLSNGKKSKTQYTINDLMTDGIIDVKAYSEMVMGNIRSYTDMIGSIFGMMGGVKGAGSEVTKSPLTFALNGAIKKMMPKLLKDSMENLNGMFEGFFTSILGGMKDKQFPGILDLIKDMFLPRSNFRGSKLDPGNYVKGKVDWDGKSRRALLEVIPTQLGQIVAALTGGPVKIYDFESGRWKTRSDLQKEWRDKEVSHARSSSGDLYWNANSALRNLESAGTITANRREQMSSQIDSYLTTALLSGDSEFLKVFERDFDYKKFGMDKQTYNFLKALLQHAKKNKKGKFMMEFPAGVYTGRESFGSMIESLNEDGSSVFNTLFNKTEDSEKSKLFLGTDQYNHDMFYYLQGIFLHTKHVSDNLPLLINGGGKKVKGSKIDRGAIRPISDISLSLSDNDKNSIDNKNLKTGKARLDKNSLNKAFDYAFDIERVTFKDKELQSYYDAKENFKLDHPDRDWSKSDKFDADKEEKIEKELKAKGFFDGVKDQLSKTGAGKAIGKFFDSISSILKIPADKMTDLYNKMSDGLINALYGTKSNKDDSLFGMIKLFFTDPREASKRMGRKLFGEKGEDGKRTGGVFSNFANSTIDNLKGAGKWFTKRLGGSAANGKQISRTGMVAVSEGELILPAELNPYYNKKVNKSKQYRDELDAIRTFYGNFANGGQAGSRVASQVYDDKTKRIIFFDENGNEIGSRPETAKEKLRRLGKEKMNSFRNSSNVRKTIDFGADSARTLFEGIKSFIENIMPSKEEVEDEKKIIGGKISDIFKDLKNESGAMGAGAILGSGVSLLTGGLISPILGAGIGAATGLVIKSKKVQDILFGEEDKNGDKTGGLLSKNISNFLSKNLPDIAVGGTIGAAGGLFMGSPVLGAILGSTIGFAKSSKAAKDYLFGEEVFITDEKGNKKSIGRRDNGIVSRELQKKIKKALPNIGAGALAGMIAGPFGIAGNIMVGSALGYASTTGKFQNWLFGEKDKDGKRSGGFVGLIKENLIEPIVGIFDKLTQEIKNTVQDTFHELGKGIRKFLMDRVRKSRVGNKVIEGAKKIGGKISNGLIKAPGAVLKAGNNWLGSRALNRGYMIRDRKSPTGWKSSIERQNYREELGLQNSGFYAGVDSILSGFNTQDELDDFNNMLNNFYDPTKGFDRDITRSRDRMQNTFENSSVDGKVATKIMDAMKKQDWDTVNSLSKKLDPDKDKIILNEINKEMSIQQNAHTKSSKVLGIKAQLEQMMGGKLKDGDIRRIQELAENEGKARNLESKEDKEKREARNAMIKVPNLLDDIIEIMLKDENILNKPKYKSSRVNKKMEEITSGKSSDTPEEGETKEMGGETHEFINGQWVNKGEHELKNKFMSTLSDHFPRLSAGLSKVSDMFGNLKEKLFGKGDEDGKGKGLFTNLFDKFFGDESPISSAISAFMGGAVGTKLSKVLKSFTLKNLITNIAAPALFGMAFTGSFDRMAKKFGWGKGDKDSNVYYTDDGSTYTVGETVDKNGNTVETFTNTETGETTTTPPSNLRVRSGDTASLSEKLQYNTARGILTNTKSVGSVVFGRTSIGKSITGGINGLKNKVGSAYSKASKYITRSANKGLGLGKGSVDDYAARFLSNDLTEGILKYCSKLKTVPVLKKIDWDGLAAKLATKCSKALTSNAAKSIASFASNAVIWIKVAFIVADFTTGYEDAATTLGIKNPSVGERIIAGLLRAIKNFIPIIGTLIPDDLLVDIFVEFVAPLFGMNIEEFKAERQAVNDEVAAYNAANGTNYDWEQYNKTVRQDYTWTERIGNAASTTWDQTKTKFSNMKKGIKEKGFGGYVKDTFNGMLGDFTSAYKENGGGISGIFSGIGNTFGNMLPGLFGDITRAHSNIMAYATRGEIGNLWKVTLPDFSGGGMNGDVETAVPGIFSKIIGQIPLIVTKLSATPIALFSKVSIGIKNIFTGIIEKVKTGISVIQQQREYGAETISDPESTLSDLFTFPEDDPENPISGLMKAALIPQRLIGAAGALIGTAFKKIGAGIQKPIEAAKTGINNISNLSLQLLEASNKGDFESLWTIEAEDTEGDPLGGVSKGLLFAGKLGLTIPTAFSWIGNKIFDSITKKITAVKDDTTSLKEKLGELKDDTDVEFKASTDNPIGTVYNVIFGVSKMIYGLFDIVGKIADELDIDEKIEKVKDFGTGVKEGAKNLWEDGKKAVKDTATNAWNSGKAAAKNAANGVWNWANNQYNAARDWISGGSSGFVSQLDPKYSKMGIGGSTVGQLGCGPAAAVMALNQYSGNMKNAVGLANQYQSGAGTDAAFFADYYARHGASARYYDNTSSAGQSNIIRSIASGSPVVLMGRDANNRSKSNSPFGPNNHYVVASGFDGAGNLIINDPESKTGSKRYSRNILRNVSLGVGIGGGNSNLVYFTNYSGGASSSTSTTREQAIWAYFKNKGYSDAATAAIMGNLQVESGLNPAQFQYGGGPGRGLAQWECTGTRFTNLVNFARQRGNKDWKDLDSQLEFINKELSGLSSAYWKESAKGMMNVQAKGTTFEQFKNSIDVPMATRQFEGAYERAGKPNIEVRIQHAINFYNKYSGRTYSYSPTDSVMYSGDISGTVSNGTIGTTSTTGSTGGLGILSTIYQAFGKIGDIFNGNSASTNITVTGNAGYNDQYSNLPVTTTAGGGLAKKFIEVAQSQLGTIEQGNNITPYGKFTGTDGQAWCAAFVSWCMNQALGGNTNKLNTALRGGKSAAVSTLWDQFRNAGAMSSTPQPGDIVIYKNNTSHTGIVESVNGNNITTIEGNTSGGNGFERNGGMVARKSFDYTKKKELTGFGRPNWDGANSAAGSGLIIDNVRKSPLRNSGYYSNTSNIIPINSGSKSNNTQTMSKSTAMLLSVIIDLVRALVSNTQRIDDIYNVLVNIAKTKANTDEELAGIMGALNNINRSDENDVERSLSSLKSMVDNILASA